MPRMPRPSPPAEELLDLLRTQPEHLAAVTRDVPAAVLSTRPAEGEWSAVEVLAHLRACGDMWGGAIAVLLDEDHPTIRAVNPRTWIDETDYRELAFRPSCVAFVRQRRDLLRKLDALSSTGWQRSATVIGAGKPLDRSVHTYVDMLAIHERAHVKQVARIVGSR